MARKDRPTIRPTDIEDEAKPAPVEAVGPSPAEVPRVQPEARPAQPTVETGQETLGPKEQVEAAQGQEVQVDDAIAGMQRRLKTPKKKKPSKVPQVRDDLTVEVERIMEAGLEEAYSELSPVEREEFRIKGEETAMQIRQLMKATHVKVKKIFRLLIDWLKMLPGINRFFLEQEAKIKTDKILGLKHHNHDQ